MKVFISWSGEQSQALAKALYDWLPLVLHYIEPWLSKSDIEAGERWGDKIAKELEATNFGIICVTKDNVNSPWILFEAGALAKSMDGGRVIPLLLDIDFKEVSGPLAQFQAKKVEQVGIEDIITAINKASQSPVPDARLKQLFDSLWTGLEKTITTIPKKASSLKPVRPESDILEELVSGIRGIEVRLRDNIEHEHMSTRRKRMRSANPEIMMDMMRRVSRNSHDPIIILMVASLLREDAPWIYELGLESYRVIKSGEKTKAKVAHKQFLEAFEMYIHGPMSEDFSDKRTHFFFREIFPMLEFEIMNHLTKNDRAA